MSQPATSVKGKGSETQGPSKGKDKSSNPGKGSDKSGGAGKQPPTGSAPSTKVFKARPVYHDTAIVVSSLGGPFIGGQKFGLVDIGIGADVNVSLAIHKTPIDSDAWIGFILEFPLGSDNEDVGFGIRFEPNRHNQDRGLLKLARTHRILVKFPRGRYTFKVDTVTGSQELHEELHKVDKLSRLQVDLQSGADVSVEGFGLPFANTSHPSNGWINEAVPIIADVTLVGLLRQRSFVFVIRYHANLLESQMNEKDLAKPFSYGYGFLHAWDYRRYQEQIPAEMGHRFLPVFAFGSDNDFLTCLAQGHVQDNFWLHETADDILSKRLPAYWVPKGDMEPIDATEFYCVVSRDGIFVKRYEDHWSRLADEKVIKLWFHEDWSSMAQPPQLKKPEAEPESFKGTEAPVGEPMEVDAVEEKPAWPKEFEAVILSNPGSIRELQDHVDKKKYPNDVILKVKARYMDEFRTYGGRAFAGSVLKNSVSLGFAADLSDTKRKVESIRTLALGSPPVSHVVSDQEYMMALERAIMLGKGFYTTLSRFDASGVFTGALSQSGLDDEPVQVSVPPPASLPALPVVDFLDIVDPQVVDAILQEALPVDRDRFRRYMSSRPLGIGLIAAPGGTGKTTALCAATLAMILNPKIKNVYGSGPTHVAVSNFAEHLYMRGAEVAARYNVDLDEDYARLRRPLIVRGHLIKQEVSAFLNVLRFGIADDSAAPRRHPRSRWQLPLSCANWFLAVLRSQAALQSLRANAVKALHPDDAKALHDMQKEVDADSDEALVRLAKLARKKLTWQEYVNGPTVKQEVIQQYLTKIALAANAVLTTPGCSTTAPYRIARKVAKGIAVDEAGCMHRADLLAVWGNTLLPLWLAGDILQLPPAVMELATKDVEGRYLNRFGPNTKISALGFLQASGLPVYRLRVQLRMCRGMFDLASTLVYGDLGVSYGPGSDPALPQHALGRAFEDYLVNVRKFDGLKPSRDGTLEPVWMHTPGTFVERVGTSKRNRQQVKLALDLLADFVKRANAAASDIVVIAPYKPNVEYGNWLLRSGDYLSLANMQPIQTADSFQGREGKLAVVIMGTNQRVGPGFISDENRLNVMITRQQNALLVVGDKKVTGEVTGDKKLLDKANKAAEQGKIVDYAPDGTVTHTKAVMLRKLLLAFQERGRFFEVVPEPKKPEEKKPEEPQASKEPDEEKEPEEPGKEELGKDLGEELGEEELGKDLGEELGEEELEGLEEELGEEDLEEGEEAEELTYDP
ncbi:hypothetical protein GQ53DRAFT_820525 [Thozetella sp. PMI_491]|nr:hypothetical protein GQ53DRAFT_820525 [Thozetella sp. PMI_491]